jgi:hypothetical protein
MAHEESYEPAYPEKYAESENGENNSEARFQRRIKRQLAVAGTHRFGKAFDQLRRGVHGAQLRIIGLEPQQGVSSNSLILSGRVVNEIFA